MLKIIPSFSYKFNVDGDPAEFLSFKKRLMSAGASIITESDKNVSLKISSNSLAMAAYPFTNDLIIVANQDDKKIEVEVVRYGEKKIALIFLFLVSVLSAAMCIQDENLKSLIFPIGSYVVIYVLSFVPAHPAHLKLKKITKFLDEA